MNTVISAKSAEDTLSIGKKLGANLKGGEVVELLSDLGSGKTTLTKGLVSGAGSSELVSSPSFTICNEYEAPKFKIYHFDFYRLNDPGIIKRELTEVAGVSDKVTIIEWPGVIEDILPEKRITITIKTTGNTSREFIVEYPKELKYIAEGVK